VTTGRQHLRAFPLDAFEIDQVPQENGLPIVYKELF
jgi:hypothetical protein